MTGRSTLGKTTLASDVILTRLISSVRQCFVACPTWYHQPQLRTLRHIPGAFPRKHVFTQVGDHVFEIIYRILKKQNFRVPTLLFVDDAAAEGATNRGNKGSFSRLCIGSPHLNLSIVGVFQRLSAASPAFRDNTECLCSFTPSKILDVELIEREFNPSPAHPECKRLVRQALTTCWNRSNFCFIYRPPRVPHVEYYSGFNERVKFPDDA